MGNEITHLSVTAKKTATFDEAMNVLSHAAGTFRSKPGRNMAEDAKDADVKKLLMRARKDAIIKDIAGHTLEDKVILLMNIQNHKSAKEGASEYDAKENAYLDRWVVQSMVESIGSGQLEQSRAETVHNTLNSDQINFLLDFMSKGNLRDEYEHANGEEGVAGYDIFIDVLSRAAMIDEVQGHASDALSNALGESSTGTS